MEFQEVCTGSLSLFVWLWPPRGLQVVGDAFTLKVVLVVGG